MNDFLSVSRNPQFLLALVCTADKDMLASLAGRPLSPGEISGLSAHPHVRTTPDGWHMDPAECERCLAAWQQQNIPEFEAGLSQALTVLARSPYWADEVCQVRAASLFVRLADRLLTSSPARFLELVESWDGKTHDGSLEGQQVAYFQAVAAARRGRFAHAEKQLATLLNSSELPDGLRARALNSQGIYRNVMGDLEGARQSFDGALALWQSLDDRESQGKVLLNLGICAYKLQLLGEAESKLQAALDIFTANKAEHFVASAKNELALVYRDQGRLEEAREMFAQVAAQRLAAGAPGSAAEARLNIAELELFQGQFGAATDTFLAVLQELETDLFRVDAYVGIGLAALAEGRPEHAVEALSTALALAREVERQDILAQVHYRLSVALSMAGDPTAARSQLLAGIEVVEQSRAGIGQEGLKIGLLGRWQQLYEALVLDLFEAGQTGQAFHWTERARARAFAEMLERGSASISAPEIARQRDAVPGGTARHEEQVVDFVSVQGDVSYVVVSFFTTGVAERTIPLLRNLPKDSPLRRILLPEPAVLRFVCGPNGVTGERLAVDPNAFSSSARRGVVQEQFLSARMRDQLQQMLLPAPQERRRMVLVPHGPLHHVPFAGLAAPAWAGLALTPSVSVAATHQVKQEARQQSADATLLAISYAGEGPTALPLATAEAAMAVSLIGGEQISPVKDAARCAAAASGAKVVHFACHGQFSGDDPLASFLAIGSDLRLTAAQVLADWRLSADLVVLSACQTSVSQVLRGDEPMGLIRAFLGAGAGAVLAAAWPVPDLSTFLLMLFFYQAVARGEDPDVALLEAQRRLQALSRAEAAHILARFPAAQLPAGDKPFAHPRYWAAFHLWIG